MRHLVGIFVGGRGTRMGGAAKGLLKAPDSSQSLVQRLAVVAGQALRDSEVILVGQHPAYDQLALPILSDAAPGAGPLAGLVALCEFAEERGTHQVIGLACDLPYLESTLLTRLARERPEAPALAPHLDGRWQPFFARYTVARALPVAAAALTSENHSLQGVLTEIGAEPLPITPAEAEQLRDWDTPGDVAGRP